MMEVLNPVKATGFFYCNESSLKNIGVFRLVGSFTWNEEAAGSNPVSYTS